LLESRVRSPPPSSRKGPGRELAARAAVALGERPAWLSKVAARVLVKYPDQPQSRLRELTRFVASDGALRVAWRRGQVPTVRLWLPPHVEMGHARWNVPHLTSPGDVAAWLGLEPRQFEWFADRRGLEREVTSERLRHYTYPWVIG